MHRDTFIDHVGRVVGITGVAMPSFWTGLIFVYVFFTRSTWRPAPLGRLGAGITCAAAYHRGLYVVDSLLTGNWQTLRSSLSFN
ncbi:MAG: hypothetical protein IPO58_06000 [Betaproteobacteria bacterium]|nr:hypothetical protein [Betaproteobacteria bacterium]